MPDPKGFLTTGRQARERRPAVERAQDWREPYDGQELLPLVSRQAGRCMDCGLPFCHSACPLGNLIPDWNDLVFHEDWAAAAERLHATNNFPEFTGRLCPALRERLRAGDQRRRRHHQGRRGGHRGPRLVARGGPAAARAPSFGSQCRGGGIRTGRSGRRPAAHPGRARGDGLRAGRPGGRPAPLRDPGLPDGQAPPRPPDRADARGGHPVRDGCQCGDHRGRRRTPRAARRAAARDRRHRLAGTSGARAGVGRHPPGDGVPPDRQPGLRR